MPSFTSYSASYLLLVLTFVVGGLIPIPRTPMVIASGAIFGLFSIPVVILASTLGGMVAFLLARHLLGERVRDRLLRRPFTGTLLRAVDLEGWRIIALMRFYGPVPTTVQNYAYAFTSVRLSTFTVVTLLFSIPQVAIYVYIGWLGTQVWETQFSHWSSLLLPIAAAVTILTVIVLVARQMRRLLAINRTDSLVPPARGMQP